MKKVLLFICCLCGVSSFAQEIELELFSSGISSPVDIQNAGDSRLFVLGQSGLIHIINENGTVNSMPFLDITDRVSNSEDEHGLLGLAFHPNYAKNGFFYVNYVNKDSETIISKFYRSKSDINLADKTTERILMTIPQPYANHNGGQLVFGKDNMLYIALGDGGGTGDPDDRAQDLESYLGKILRIDVNNFKQGENYGIPKNNPFVDDEDALDEIWAYGLRNPWRFSIDKATNEMWIADVGQENIEEINKVAATTGGINYGWRCYEGDSPYNLDDCDDDDSVTFPISEYTHNDSGAFKCSITGGFRYRGNAQPSLSGIYFFADFCSAEIGMLQENQGNWDMSFSQAFTGNNWSTFGEDMNGELYIADISSGSIYKIKDANLGLDDQNFSQIKLYPNPVNDVLTLDFGRRIDPKSEMYVYNLQGQQIKTLITFEDNSLKISTKTLAEGMYILEILTDNGQKTTRKFVKN